MSNESINDDEIMNITADDVMNITAEQVKLLYIKEILKEIIEEARKGKISYEARLNNDETIFLEKRGFNVELLCSVYDYTDYNDDRIHWYTITW